MSAELLLASVVITAEQFNPSAISPGLLSRLGVLGPDQNSTFRPDLVQVSSPQAFDLIVLPPQLQMTFHDVEGGRRSLEHVLAIVRELPNTPFTAVGLNFHYVVEVVGDLSEVTRRLFAPPDAPHVFTHFGDGNPMFGAYMSRDFGTHRLRVEFKPLTIPQPDGTVRTGLLTAANLHQPLGASADKASDIGNFLATNWESASQQALELATEIERNA